jgi:hypothetical protein
MQHARPAPRATPRWPRRSPRRIAEGIVPSIYCHAIGYHGHAAGPPIGMTDYQDGRAGARRLRPAPERLALDRVERPVKVPEWDGQEVRFALEEDAALLEGGWDWVLGRQTRFYLIR